MSCSIMRGPMIRTNCRETTTDLSSSVSAMIGVCAMQCIISFETCMYEILSIIAHDVGLVAQATVSLLR
jgi:hypothetical protein